MQNNTNYDVIIIGGGASGFAAAAFFSLKFNTPKKKILIIEKNKSPMKKLSITGKGRCNLTNVCRDVYGENDNNESYTHSFNREIFLKNIPVNNRFLMSALSKFTPVDTMEFFENIGVPLKVERGGRVFPVSDKAIDVVTALKKAASCDIVTDRAIELVAENGCIKKVRCEKSTYHAKSIILATGGESYPLTGSTGDGYTLSKGVGHTIIPPKPALVPMEVCDKDKADCSSLSGLSLKNVVLTITDENGDNKAKTKHTFKQQGELLFTHFGVSGPLVLSGSFYVNDPENTLLSIDLKPALDEKTLDNRILRDFSLCKNKQLKNSLSNLLPSKMIPIFIRKSGIPEDKCINTITKSERRQLIQLFKAFPLRLKALRKFEEAIITNGGISTKEISSKTMESKLIKNLYFTGEVIDTAGLTGGFNLQIAFSTAYAAAFAIASI